MDINSLFDVKVCHHSHTHSLTQTFNRHHLLRHNPWPPDLQAPRRDIANTHPHNPQGKVVLVTGGAKGIGRMISEGFVTNGAKVYISSRDAKACEKAAAELNELGMSMGHISCPFPE